MTQDLEIRRFVASGLRCVVGIQFESGAKALGLDRPESFDQAMRGAQSSPGGRGENFLLSCTLWPERTRLRPLRHGGLFGWLGGDRYLSSQRAEKEFRVWQKLEARSAPIPTPVLAASRRNGIFWKSTFGAVNREGAQNALDWLRDRPRALKTILRAAHSIARSIRRFHDAGGLHGDLHLANTLIDEADGEMRCWVVDLGRTSLKKQLSPQDRFRDLMRLWRSIEKTGRKECLDPRVRAKFLSVYCAGDRTLRKGMLAFAARERRRLRRHRMGWRLGRALATGAVAIGALACSESTTHAEHLSQERPRLSLLATGDTGRSRILGSIFEGQLAVSHVMVEEDRGDPVDGLILLGDNFYYNGLDREHLVERIKKNLVRPYCHFLDMSGPRGDEVEASCPIERESRHPIPVYAVLGNHDLEQPGSAELQRNVIPEFLPGWRMSASLAEVVELTEGVSLILFESEISIDDERAITEALVDAIRRARGPWRILATHRPIATDDLGGPPRGGYPAWVRNAIAQAGVPLQLALAGHHHSLQAFALEEPSALLQIGAGSGSRASAPLATAAVAPLFGAIELGFARIDLIGRGESERLAVSLFGTASWPIIARVTGHQRRARLEVDRFGGVRRLDIAESLAD